MGVATEKAAARKQVKYCQLSVTHLFVPLAFETMGLINNEGLAFLSALGKNLCTATGSIVKPPFYSNALH